jgi:DNA-binding GntR family transcriptional regulator
VPASPDAAADPAAHRPGAPAAPAGPPAAQPAAARPAVPAVPPAAARPAANAAQPAAARAYAHVKERLLDGRYAEGELLSEGAIAAELGVSRTPVREALLQLEGEHLLTLYPKRGALVTPVGARDVAELFETRLLLERHCMAGALAGDTAALATGLDAQLERQRDAIARDDAAAFGDADREFHRVWVAAAGNRILLELYDRLRDRQQRATAALLATRSRRAPILLDEHEAIADALRAGDAATAGERLEEHLAASQAAR